MSIFASQQVRIKIPNKVLVISTRQIGDALLTTPLIHSLRLSYPTAQIDVLVFVGKDGVLADNADINQVISVSEKPSRLEYWQTIRRIFKQYDVAFITQASDRGHVYGLLAAKQRVGLIPQKISHHWWKKITCAAWQVLDDENTHTVTQNLLLAECVGLNLNFTVTTPKSPQSADFLKQTFNIDVGKLNYVVIHPYPMWQYKLWTIAGWQTVIKHLHNLNLHVVISCGNAENELRYCNKVAALFSSMVTNLAGKISFSDATCLIQSAKVYIGMDTVMTHLAAATGTRTLAIFGPTNPIKWAPWPVGYADKKSPWQRHSTQYQLVNNVMLLQGSGDCVPCHKAGCDDNNNSHSQCLEELPAERVIDALTILLKNIPENTSHRKIIPICASS